MMDGSASTLPEEMIIDILTRLPVKSLLRFKSVSQDWLSLFTSPKFITSHLHQSEKNPSFILNHSNDHGAFNAISLLQYTEPITPHAVHKPPSMVYNATFFKNYLLNPNSSVNLDILMLGCGGGLLCTKKFHSKNIEYVLWNPATRKFKYVKCPQQSMKVQAEGFGFNGKINDYKSVKIGLLFHVPDADYYSFDNLYRKPVDSVIRALVFSWRTDSWRVVKDRALAQDSFYTKFSVCVKGKLYWLVRCSGNRGNQEFILAFDTAKDKFRRIDLPYSVGECKITEFKDSLALFAFPRKDGKITFVDLWALNENELGQWKTRQYWKHLFTINDVSELHWQLWMWRDKVITWEPEVDRYLLYDPISEEDKHLPRLPDYVGNGCDYVESLVSVDGTDSIVEEDASL